MGRYNLSPTARQDLLAIHRYISRGSPAHADRVVEAIRERLRQLADRPELGHCRDDLTERRLRFWPIYSYLIVYRPDTVPIEVVAVPSGFQDVQSLLDQMPDSHEPE